MSLVFPVKMTPMILATVLGIMSAGTNLYAFEWQLWQELEYTIRYIFLNVAVIFGF